MLLPPRQATHGITPDWSHDDKSRQAFQRTLRENEPSPERAEERERMRQEFLDRIFYIFQEEAEDTDRGDTEDTYEEAVNISAT